MVVNEFKSLLEVLEGGVEGVSDFLPGSSKAISEDAACLNNFLPSLKDRRVFCERIDSTGRGRERSLCHACESVRAVGWISHPRKTWGGGEKPGREGVRRHRKQPEEPTRVMSLLVRNNITDITPLLGETFGATCALV